MIAKVAPMNSTPEFKYEVGVILNQLEKKGYATTSDVQAFRYFSKQVRCMREQKQLWVTTGCAIEQRNGIKHVIQINPDYKFTRVDELTFKLTYRY